MVRVARTAFWTIIAIVLVIRVYEYLILPMLLKLGVPHDLCIWIEPPVIEMLTGWTFGMVFVAAVGVFRWNDQLSLMGFLFWMFLWTFDVVVGDLPCL